MRETDRASNKRALQQAARRPDDAGVQDDEFKAFQEAVAAFGWRYGYLALSLLSKQAVAIIR